MTKLTLAHTRTNKKTFKLALANVAIIATAFLFFSPAAYASTKTPVDKAKPLPSVVSGIVDDSTQQTLDRLQQLAASAKSSAVSTDLPELERDDFWATSQKTLDHIAAVKHKAALAKKAAAKAKKLAALATAPTSVIQSYAHQQVLAKGWSEADFTCLVNLWNKESGWNPKAENTSSGAYGIPQALPGSKMATAGANWKSDYRVQINWGLGYIASSYGTPCSAWGHSQSLNWY